VVYIFFGAWICAWTWVGIKDIGKLLDNYPSPLPAWPLGWAFGEIVMICFLLSVLGAGETLRITPDFLKCRMQIFGIGFTREYLLHEVLNLRYQLPMNRRPGGLAFDYEGRTVRFVSDVTNTEAVELLGHIRRRMREYGALKAEEKDR